MPLTFSRSIRWAGCLAAVALVAACAPQAGPGRGGPGGGGPGGGLHAGPGGERGGFRGGLIVRPIALVFVDFDDDGDRAVSEAEFNAGAANAWDEADANADGAITPFEFTDWAKAVMGAENPNPGRIAFDRNLDTRITRVEFLQTLASEFGALDTNRDHVVTRDEMVRVVEIAAPRRSREQQSRQRPSGGPPSGGRRPRVSQD